VRAHAAIRPPPGLPDRIGQQAGLTTSPTAYTFGSLVWPYSLTDSHRPLVRVMIRDPIAFGHFPDGNDHHVCRMESPLSKTSLPVLSAVEGPASKDAPRAARAPWYQCHRAGAFPAGTGRFADIHCGGAGSAMLPGHGANTMPTSPAPITTTVLPATSRQVLPLFATGQILEGGDSLLVAFEIRHARFLGPDRQDDPAVGFIDGIELFPVIGCCIPL